MAATRGGERQLRVGLEVEFIPVRQTDGTRLPLTAHHGSLSATGVLQAAARRRGWAEDRSPYGTPLFRIPGTGAISFEPGGQIELSTAAFTSVDRLVAHTRAALEPLFHAAEGLGVRLVARGMDPHNRVDDVPLFVDAPRYRRQAAHYDRIGPWGRRMMLQSAALHVNLDLGGRPVRRWWAANAATPCLLALFANSPRCEGRDAGVRSCRAEQWRHLDPQRTGIFAAADDPAGAYTAFALEAPAFLLGEEDAPAVPFRTHWETGAGVEEWEAHLTTLFPEVRPRGYLELRTPDTLPPRWLSVPLVISVGLLYDPGALLELTRLAPRPSTDLLRRAGRDGMTDPDVRALATTLFDLGLQGAEALGESVVGGRVLEVTREFRHRFVSRGLDPGHEEHEGDLFAL